MSSEDRGQFHVGGRTGFLLIHGLSGTPVELRYVANGLARAGYTVACPQLAGHCATLEEFRVSTWRQWYQSVDAALHRLSDHCDRIFVGGLSMGAVLALRLAARHPDTVAGAVLLSPTLWFDGWNVPWYGRLLALVRHKWFADLMQFSESAPYGVKDVRLRALIADAIHSGDPSRAGFLSIPGGPMLELRWLVNDVCKKLGDIKQPVLILHPRQDDRASLRNTFYLEERLGGRVEKVVLEDSYHLITLDRQRDTVLEKTVRFAQSVAAGVVPASRERKSGLMRPIAVA